MDRGASKRAFGAVVAIAAGSFLASCRGGPGPRTSAPFVAPPPLTAPAARWHFPAASLRETTSLDLGREGRLVAALGGRRAVVAANGTTLPREAEVILPSRILAMRRETDGAFLFVGASGDTYVARDPVGPIVATRRGRGPLRMADFGRRAVVGVTPEGTIVRSEDGGLAWSEVGIAGLGSAEPLGAAIRADGRGLLVAIPQRAFATTDDGATWSPVATPGIGARAVVEDARGRLLLEGIEPGVIARLEDAPLRLTRETVSTVASPRKETKQEERLDLIGERVVRLSHDPRTDRDRLQDFEDHDAVNGCVDPVVASSAHRVLVACMARSGKPDRVAESVAGASGSPWSVVHVAPLQAVMSAETERRSERSVVAVSDDGWAFVAFACDIACPRPLVRRRGAATFEDATIPGAYRILGAVSGMQRAFVLAATQKGIELFSAGADDVTFAPTGFVQPMSGVNSPKNATLVSGPRGEPVMLARTSGWTLVPFDDAGKPLAQRHLPPRFVHVSLAGTDGLAVDDSGAGWQTADAGESWSAAAVPCIDCLSLHLSAEALRCTTVGCTMREGVRVGWDRATLPKETRLRATDTAPARTAFAPKPRGELACVSVRLNEEDGETCEGGGCLPLISRDLARGIATAGVDHAAVRWVEGRARKARLWAAEAVNDRQMGGIDVPISSAVQVQTKPGPRGKLAELLPPEPAIARGRCAKTVFGGVEGGAVALRFVFDCASAESGEVSARVDVAWYATKSDRVFRRSLGDIPLVIEPGDRSVGARSAWNARTKIVDGGLFLNVGPTPSQPLRFLRENGADDTRPWPGSMCASDGDEHGHCFDVYAEGQRIRVAQAVGEGSVRVHESDDGHGWTTSVWTLSRDDTYEMEDVSGRAYLTFRGRMQSRDPFVTRPRAFALGAPTPDPPKPIEVDLAALLDGKLHPCRAEPAGGLVLRALTDVLHVQIPMPSPEDPPWSPGELSIKLRGTESGACIEAYSDDWELTIPGDLLAASTRGQAWSLTLACRMFEPRR